MKILHIDLKPNGSDDADLRFFWDNPNNCQFRERFPLAEIKGLIDLVKKGYYTIRPEDYAKTGQALYNWLDGSDRLLANALNEPHPQGLMIAIATSQGLANLPWELLHDGKCFLVEKKPSIIPVRWVSNGKPITSADNPQNRPLNMLFMATSPLEVEPQLDYEAEEGRILEATKRTPVNLQVEESGNLDELHYLIRAYPTENQKSYFDVVHLTGHANFEYGNPCFLTEDEYGNRVDSNTGAIANALRDNSGCLPPLIVLSGCRTGYSSDNAIPSMAEELLNLGATAVLGWGERVRDTDATAAAGKLYWELSQGGILIGAIASCYQTLIEQKVPDWHKLRLYVAHTLPEALVTPLRTRGRKQLPKLTNIIEFRDDEKRLRVATRENFVGRRRQLQNCLRTLKTDTEKVGVLVHGMGGWGKSSIASRLWDRLPDHEKILWWQQIDEPYLIKKLKDKLIKPEQQELISYLENSNIPLKSRLAYLFKRLAEFGEKPFLLIFDDFEWNLEPREGGYILRPEVSPILAALFQAIQETGTDNKIIITCRYDFNSDLLEDFYKQGLEPLKNAELTKKLSRLENFSSGKLHNDLRERALNLADGNPRLLEFLNDEVLGSLDADTKLTQLEQSPELWKYKIIWPELYQLIDEPLQRILSYCLVYDISVPIEALEAVCNSKPNYQRELQRGLKLGLIEVSPEPEESKRTYRAGRILPHIIPTIQLPPAPKVYSLYQKAHDKLYQLWGNRENESSEEWREIFRLKFANKENSERFREAFYQMFAVQYNLEADSAFESELRKCALDLVKNGLCTSLENYLKQKQWKKADEETAWIFYQVMVKENYKDWVDLLKNFPCETLAEINRLWLENSNNKFGISIQTKIYQDLGGTIEYRFDVWGEFSDHVGWRQGFGNWFTLYQVIYRVLVLTDMTQAASGTLPALIYSRDYIGFRHNFSGWKGWWDCFSSLASKLVDCNL